MENCREELLRLLDNPDWSEKDRKWMLEYLGQNHSEELRQIMHELFSRDVDPDGLSRDERARQILEMIHRQIGKKAGLPRKDHLLSWFRLPAAAAILILVMISAGAVYLYMKTTHNKEFAIYKNITPAQDLPPGGNKAVLTLADGGRIILDTVSSGTIARQSGVQIIKSGNGQIEYQSEKRKTKEVEFNSVATPLGGQYQLTLSDGSLIWLNAASSIRFPASFSGDERKVFITGEVYFEVAHQYSSIPSGKKESGNVPFIVEVEGKGRIEVTGTRFNVNAYRDENLLAATLLEGGITFTQIHQDRNKTPVLLLPGQQALLSPEGEVRVNNQVNLEKVVAWKNGYFLFSSSTIEEVMSQVARWYDVEIIYENKNSERKFGGKIQMNLNLSQVLQILEKNNIRFKLDGRKLYVRS